MSQNKKQNKSTVNKKTGTIFIITAVVAILLIATLIGLGSSKHTETASPTPSPTDTKQTTAGQIAFDLKDRPFLGKQDAPVTIVEFADFKCPACKSWDQRLLPQLKKDYLDSGKAKLYFYNFPIIGPDSYTAMEAGQSIYHQNPEAFWTYYTNIFDKQQEEKKSWATVDFLTKFTKDNVPGVDAGKVKTDLENHTYNKNVKDDLAFGEKIGVNSTPTVFINGKKINNPFDYKEIVSAIEGK